MQINQQPVSRAPNGVLSDNPVYLRLLPNELSAFTQRARTENRSLSSMARLLILQALEVDTVNSKPSPAQAHAVPIARS